MAKRNWTPCRVCGADHTNPMSSSICSPCGAAERKANERERLLASEEYQASAFGQFMNLPEEDRWRLVFDRLQATRGDNDG